MNDEIKEEIRKAAIKEVLDDLRDLLEFYRDRRTNDPKDNLYLSKCRQFGIDSDKNN